MKKFLRKISKKMSCKEIFWALVLTTSLLVTGDSPIRIQMENVNLVQINHIEQVE